MRFKDHAPSLLVRDLNASLSYGFFKPCRIDPMSGDQAKATGGAN